MIFDVLNDLQVVAIEGDSLRFGDGSLVSIVADAIGRLANEMYGESAKPGHFVVYSDPQKA